MNEDKNELIASLKSVESGELKISELIRIINSCNDAAILYKEEDEPEVNIELLASVDQYIMEMKAWRASEGIK